MSAPVERDPQPGDEPAPRGAGQFGWHDFRDLWRASVVGGEDLAATTVFRADDGKPDAELFDLLNAALKVDDEGVWIVAEDTPAPGVELWSPNMHMPEAGHWRSKAALPFPFTPGNLAAFMLAGPGRWLADAFGRLDRSTPDLSWLPVGRDMQAAAERTKRLLMLAWGAYHAALKEVGPRPLDPDDAIPAHLLRQVDDAAGGVDQIDGAEGGPEWSPEAEWAWREAMCRRLRDQPQTTTATATAAAAAAAGGGAEPIAARRSRRLVRLRELGADLAEDVTASDGWRLTGQRGALALLSREEKAAKRPQSDERDLKHDLVAAMRVDRGY